MNKLTAQLISNLIWNLFNFNVHVYFRSCNNITVYRAVRCWSRCTWFNFFALVIIFIKMNLVSLLWRPSFQQSTPLREIRINMWFASPAHLIVVIFKMLHGRNFLLWFIACWVGCTSNQEPEGRLTTIARTCAILSPQGSLKKWLLRQVAQVNTIN